MGFLGIWKAFEFVDGFKRAEPPRNCLTSQLTKTRERRHSPLVKIQTFSRSFGTHFDVLSLVVLRAQLNSEHQNLPYTRPLFARLLGQNG